MSQILQSVSPFVYRIAFSLQSNQLPNHRCYWRLRQRITRCNVQHIDFGWNAMDNSLQQRFVTHHHRRVLSYLVTVIF